MGVPLVVPGVGVCAMGVPLVVPGVGVCDLDIRGGQFVGHKVDVIHVRDLDVDEETAETDVVCAEGEGASLGVELRHCWSIDVLPPKKNKNKNKNKKRAWLKLMEVPVPFPPNINVVNTTLM